MSKIIATVITYNRKDLLDRILDALIHQSFKDFDILVVDNNSTDGTEKLIKDKYSNIVKYLKLDKNLGGSGGQYHAMKYAYDNNYNYVWTMDDDGLPEKNCLEVLIHSKYLSEDSIINSIVLNIEDKKYLSFGIESGNQILTKSDEVTGDIQGYILPFNGTLIGRNVLKKIGYPILELFIWGDEQEYFYRAKKYGIGMYIIKEALFYHPSSYFSFKEDIDIQSFWKVYYMIRNMKYYQKHKYSFAKFPIMNLGNLTIILIQIILFQKSNKFQKLRLVFIAYIDSITNNLKKDVQDIKKICS